MRNEIATWSLLEGSLMAWNRALTGQHNGMIFCMKIRVDHWSHASGIFSWSKKCMTQYWNFASYIANLPAEHWVRRTPAWKPRPTYPPRGRQQIWDTKLEMLCRYKALQLGNCCEKCGPMGLSFAVFLGFRDACRLYRVWHFLLYIFFSFPPPPLHWARLRALGLTCFDLMAWNIAYMQWLGARHLAFENIFCEVRAR